MTKVSWFKGIRFKLAVLILVPVVVIIALLVGAGVATANLSEAITQTTTQDIPSALSLSALNAGLFTMTVDFYKAAGESDIEKRKIYIGAAKKEYTSFINEIEEYRKYDMSPEEKDNFSDFEKHWKNQKTIVDQVLDLLDKNDVAAVTAVLHSNYSTSLDMIDENFSKFDTIQTDASKAMYEKSEKLKSTTNLMLRIFGVSAILVILAFGTITVIRLIKDLTVVTGELSASIVQVDSSATQAASSSQAISQSTVQQAASLEETAASLEEISSMISKSAENANLTASSSAKSQEKAEEGSKVIGHMLSSMEEISASNEAIMNQVNHSNQQMTEIVKVIQEIGNKTNVINDIVFQTKLLSFNASVEAARAGENGKGFAVVAEEVGNLAQMSGSAAKDISDMLASSMSKVESIINETKSGVENLISEGKRKVDSGSAVARQCADILNEIVTNVSAVSNLAKEISQASREQAQGVAEINKAMGQLDAVTQQNSAANEQTSTAAVELSSQVATLKSSVEKLSTTINGDAA